VVPKVWRIFPKNKEFFFESKLDKKEIKKFSNIFVSPSIENLPKKVIDLDLELC
jgi:hypothetical protein